MSTNLYPERTYGNGYVEVYEQHATAADIARLVRRDLKAAKKDGAFPEGVTFSVRCRNFAGGRSVDVTIKGYEGPVSCPECRGQRNSRTYAGQHGDLCHCVAFSRSRALGYRDAPPKASEAILGPSESNGTRQVARDSYSNLRFVGSAGTTSRRQEHCL